MSQERLYQLAKEGLISEINNVSEKINIIEKKMKRSPQSKNTEIWKVAIEGYKVQINKLEMELLTVDEHINSVAAVEG